MNDTEYVALVDTTRDELRDRIGRARARFDRLIRTADPHARVPGLDWTVHQVIAHIGSHLGHGRLTLLLNREIGVSMRPARGGALCALAGDLPAPVLAEVLGLSISADTGWVAVAARDEAHYLKARIAKPPQRGDGIGPIHAGAALRCRCPQLPFGR